MYFGLYDTLKPMLLGADAGVGASFILGWAVTITAGLMSYPIDTVRRRMMMTSGAAVKYKSSLDCFMQVCKGEGFMSLMKAAGTNNVYSFLTILQTSLPIYYTSFCFPLLSDLLLKGMFQTYATSFLVP